MADYEQLIKLEQKTKPAPAATAVQNKHADLPASQQTGLEAKKQTTLPANQQGSKQANQQTSKEVNKHADLPASQQSSKVLKKFSSYLTEDSLKGLKRIAFETDCKDYEVLQEAVDTFLARLKQ